MALSRSQSILTTPEQRPWAHEQDVEAYNDAMKPVGTQKSVAPETSRTKAIAAFVVGLLCVWLVAALIKDRDHIFATIDVQGNFDTCTQKCHGGRDTCLAGLDPDYLHPAAEKFIRVGDKLLFKPSRDSVYPVGARDHVWAVVVDVPKSSKVSVKFANSQANLAAQVDDLYTGVLSCETDDAINDFPGFQACKSSERLYGRCTGGFGPCSSQCDSDKLQAKGWNSLKYTFFLVGLIILGLAWGMVSEHLGAGAFLSSKFENVSIPDSVRVFGLPAAALAGLVVVIVARLAKAAGSGEFGSELVKVFQPMLGLAIIPGVWYLRSESRAAIQWRTVLGGIALDVLLALSMQIGPCQDLVSTMGDLVSSFLEFSLTGSHAVFGEEVVRTGFFAFKVMPTVIFFSAVVSVAYYAGALQVCILKVAAVLRALIGTSTIEAVSSSGNIFLGMTEIPLLMRPLLPVASVSELHAVLTCGYASVAGSILAAYIGLGVKAEYLVLACFMSAPAGIALSKLAYPDCGDAPAGAEARQEDDAAAAASEEKDADQEIREALKSNDGSLVEAAGNGASNAIVVVANIVAVLIAFLALVTAANALVRWAFACVGFENVSFSMLCGILLSPLAFMIGVPPSECRAVGLLLAQKLVLNEIVAYSDLTLLVKNAGGAKLEVPPDYNIASISAQTEMTATFAICGFANLSAVGIQLGALSAICPERRRDFAGLVMRAMLVGFSVPLMNACIASLLMKPV